MASVSISIHSTDTIADAFEALSKAFPVTKGGTSQWVTIVDAATEVSVTLFGPTLIPEVAVEPITAEPESLRA